MQIEGAQGTLTVTPPASGDAPQVDINGPFSVSETVVTTVTEGTGEVVPEKAEVTVDYHGVNGRDGNNFDSSYKRGAPVSFPLDGVVKGFAKAIAGQKVGSDVVVAMTPEDGYGRRGNPMAGIQGDDTLVFFIHIHGVN